MSKKEKLLEKLRARPKNFTWDEAVSLMESCDFSVRNARGGGSGRMFIHGPSKLKVRLHEPHPSKTLLPYMLDRLIEALTEIGELK